MTVSSPASPSTSTASGPASSPGATAPEHAAAAATGPTAGLDRTDGTGGPDRTSGTARPAAALAKTSTGPSATEDAAPGLSGEAALRVEGLTVAYPRRGRSGGGAVLAAVDLTVAPGQIVGVIGETGSGKTTLARAVVGGAPVTSGRIEVDGVEVSALRGRALREHRRSGRVQYMFQDPLRSLDPDLTVTDLVGEPLAVAGVERAERRERAAEALHRVGLDAGAVADRVPAQLSGGQRQRVSLARAVVTRPALLLADEPVSALDASNRNHVLRLLDELRRDLGVAIVVISHDLSSLAGIADRIAVLYRGRIVEQGPTAQVLTHPLHPYTALLTASAPRIDRNRTDAEDGGDGSGRRRDRAAVGAAPAWAGESGACAFAHRCPLADADCRTRPGTSPHPGERAAACHHPLAAAS